MSSPIRLAAAVALVLLPPLFAGIAGEKSPRGEEKPVRRTLPDWPMFGGGPSRNLVNPIDRNIPSSWDVRPGRLKNIKWMAELGNSSVSISSPVVAGGKVFIGTNNDRPRNPKVKGDRGVLMCFDAADGKFLWQALHEKLGNNSNDWPQVGIASTACVDRDRVYYVSNRCELVCADTEGFRDGKNDGVTDEKYQGKEDADIIWRLDMMRALKVHPHYLAISSPLVVGDLLFVLTGHGTDDEYRIPAPEAPSFLAVDRKTGKVKWQDSSPGKNILEGQWGSPAYAVVGGKGQVIFPGGDGWLYGFEAETGKHLWKFDCNPKTAVFKPGGRGTRNFLLATPVVSEGKVYIGTGLIPEDGPGVGHFWCIDLGKATEKGVTNKDHDVSPHDDNFDPKAAANKDSALAWHFGGEIPAPPKDADRDYHFGRTMSTCAIADGLVYVPEVAGWLYCLDARTGTKVWDYDLQASTWASPYVVDGKVLLGTDDQNVFVFQHGRAVPNQVPTVEVDDCVKGSPAVAGGVLYLCAGRKLYAIQNR